MRLSVASLLTAVLAPSAAAAGPLGPDMALNVQTMDGTPHVQEVHRRRFHGYGYGYGYGGYAYGDHPERYAYGAYSYRPRYYHTPYAYYYPAPQYYRYYVPRHYYRPNNRSWY